MMKISAHQSAYWPWLGYLDKIMQSDIFIVDDVSQFSRYDFINRNYFRNADEKFLLSVPINRKSLSAKSLVDVRTNHQKDWETYHLKRIKFAYSHTPYFETYFSEIEGIYAHRWDSLVELNKTILNMLLLSLDIRTPIIYRSAHRQIVGYKSDLVLSMCQFTKASEYYSGQHGIDYLNLNDFSQAGITVKFQNFASIPYQQVKEPFISNFSALDTLFNVGPIKTKELIVAGHTL